MKTNSIYEALNNVDDKFVSEAARVKRKRPMALIIAAAAAMLGLVGFTTATIAKNTAFIPDVGSVKYNVYKQDITLVPEEELPRDPVDAVDMPTAELFAKLGISPLMSDKFSYDPTSQNQFYTTDNTPVNICLPRLTYYDNFVYVNYWLYSKSLDRNIEIITNYPTNDDYDMSSEWEKGNSNYKTEADYDCEIIKLKDGSNCVITHWRASFAHNGVLYSVFGDPTNDDLTHEELKQLLRDFDLL